MEPKPTATALTEVNPFLNNNAKEKPKTSFLKNLKSYFSQYSSATSIHGIQYLGQTGRYLIEKLVWTVVIVTVVSLCLILIRKTYNKWQTSPVIVTFSTTETPIYEIPFPAVTLCPQAKFNPDVFNYTGIILNRIFNLHNTKKERELYNILSLACGSVHSFGDILHYEEARKTLNQSSLSHFLSSVPLLDSSGTMSVRWIGEELVINDALIPTFTSEGICYTFNSLSYPEIFKGDLSDEHSQKRKTKTEVKQWSLQKGYPSNASMDAYPRRTFLPGISGGLFIDALFTNHSHLDYLCDESLQGYKVVLHHPSELPNMDKHFRLPLDHAVYVGVKASMITVADALIDYSPNVRKCYFAEEKPLGLYKMYTQQNCLAECLTNYTLKECGCVAFYMITNSDMPICGLGSLDCVINSKVRYLETNSSNEIGGQHCGCLPPCTSLTYEIETSQSAWNWKEVFKVVREIGLSEFFPNEEESHYSRLVVYYKNMQFLSSERNELYGYVDFFSNIGGLMGLFIGFSVTSAIEILYFLSLRLICNLKRYGTQLWSGDLDLINAS